MSFESVAYLDPLKRSRNTVDELRKQIEKLQSECEHMFKLSKQPDLLASKISGDWIINSLENVYGIMHLSCTECSLSVSRNTNALCPNCLEETTYGISGRREDRRKYFDDDIQHIETAIPYSCANCGFRGVYDESHFDNIRC